MRTIPRVSQRRLEVVKRSRRQAGREPSTRVLVDGPRSGAGMPEPDWSALPPGCDRWLVLEAAEDEGGQARRWRCAIGGDRFSVRVGRSDADLVVPHASVSRTHARLDGRGGLRATGGMESLCC